MTADAAAPEKREFKAELKQLMDIIAHSLYTNKDIFLRELISNACDAIDKVRFESLTNQDLLDGDSEWKIRIVPDAKAATLTVSDNGIGMSRESVVEELGTIAKSGTQEFLARLREAEAKDRPELIGQFGVGFYSAFMVADKVTVVSRTAGDPAQGVKWESDGEGEYTLETVEKPARGTDVTLHLRDDAKDYLEPWRLQTVVRRFSDFVEHPVMLVTQPEPTDDEPEPQPQEEQANSGKAIWMRPKSEVTEEEYREFYQHLTRDAEEPLKTIHYSAEGRLEFSALLYIPRHKPLDMAFGPPKTSVHLYIRRVFISDDCDALLPMYLRFVKGVVDSSDLPLNVSRETFQDNPLLEKIRNNLVGKILGTLADMQENDNDDYVAFYRELGHVLKEGVTQDWSNQEKLADLLLFESTKTKPGEYTTLAQYVQAMPEEQAAIYYLTGESRDEVELSPLLESLRAGGREVLLLTDAVDEFMVQALTEYKGKKLQAADRGELPEAKDESPAEAAAEENYRGLLDFIKERVPEVKEVRLSSRLTESAACLVADEGGMGAHMERIMERLGQRDQVPGGTRVLELKADHPAVEAMRALHERNPEDPRVADYAQLLYDQAVIAEGSKVSDPVALARRINALLVKDAGGQTEAESAE